MSQIEAPQGINTEAFASALPADQIPGPTEFQAPIIDQNPFTQRRQIKKIAGITGLVGTATLAFTGAVGAQEASPVPSQNPDTALAGEENCPPGYHADSTEVVSGTLQNGDIVNVSFPDASPLPSGSPAVEEVVPSPSPEPISVGGEPEETPSSDNPPAPEEPITITDPETGETIVCFPDEQVIELGPEEVSIDVILNGEYKKISKKQFTKIIEDTAPAILAYWISIEEFSADTDLEWFIDFSNNTYTKYLKTPKFSIIGRSFSESLVNQIAIAQERFKAGDYETAEAFMSKAKGIYRLGRTYMKFDGSSSQFDKQIEKFAKKNKLN